MDALILAEKLESLRRCIARIEERRADSAGALAADVDRQDIVTLNLTRAVQLCVDMAAHVLTDASQAAPRSMSEAFDRLAEQGVIEQDLASRMRSAVGFRNVAILSYRRIDWDIVHAITHEDLDDFRRFAAAVAQRVDG